MTSGWTDDPLVSAGQDELGREHYAANAAQRILDTHSFDSSVVFGLSGPWGSGKTSLVNMIINELSLRDHRWSFAYFTPWATSDVTGLLTEFYSALTDALPPDKGRKARDALSNVARVVAPIAQAVPVAGGAMEGIAESVADHLGKRPSWQRAFGEASKRLKKLGVPILVVVDDIDRLQRDELLTLLKVIRLLGRFPGVQYLLAYDDDTLYRNLHIDLGLTDHDGAAEQFMEKIVQYPLLVPPMLRTQQVERLNRGFDAIRPGAPDIRLPRVAALLDCFLAMLRTPRAIDRYTAQVRHHTPMWTPNEIDDEDVALLTLLRVSCPAMFNQLPLYRSQLISGHTGEWKLPITSGIDYVEFDPDPLIALAPLAFRQEAALVLHSLFPRTKSARNGHQRGYSSHSGRGICVEEYFDRYFAMSIPAHDVSDVEVHEAALSAWTGEPTTLIALAESSSRERQMLVVAKLARPENLPTADCERLEFSRVLVTMANLLEDSDSRLSAQDAALSLLAQQLTALPPDFQPEPIWSLLSGLSETYRRIRLLDFVGYNVNDRRGPPPAWIADVKTLLADESVENFVANLTARDQASSTDAISYQVRFALRVGATPQIQDQVQRLLHTGEIELDDLAARFITTSSMAGLGDAQWKLHEPDQDTFNHVAPPSDDPWYDQPAVSVDQSDLNWPNRRKYARGRFKRPPTTDPEPIPAQGDEGEGDPTG